MPYYASTYLPGEARVVPVRVEGAPFGETKTDLTVRVIEAMRGHTAYPTDFWPLPDGQEARAYRVVWMFNPPAGVSNFALCAEGKLPDPLPPRPDGTIEVSTAFCRGDRPLSAVNGTIRAGSAEDPAFLQSIARYTYSMFPAQNPEGEGRGGFGRGVFGGVGIGF